MSSRTTSAAALVALALAGAFAAVWLGGSKRPPPVAPPAAPVQGPLIRVAQARVADREDRNSPARERASPSRAVDAALTPLREALLDPDPAVREAAVEALGEAATRESLQALAVALNDHNAEVRLAAVYSLGDAHDALAVLLLQQALSDTNFDVRESAAQLLSERER